MSVLRFILGDQLSKNISSLKDADKKDDLILMAEVMTEATYVKHHPKKIAFIFSAMRHFAEELRADGFNVLYYTLDQKGNPGSFESVLQEAIQSHQPQQVVITHPGEYRVLASFENFQKQSAVPIEILEDTRFICNQAEFAEWAKDRKALRMEFFYRTMRKQYNVLMNDSEPEGGRWNYDKDNRKPLITEETIPKTYLVEPDAITHEVLDLVREQFSDHFGDLEPFSLAVTRDQALEALQMFIDKRLVLFGDYQDAMVEGEPWLFHSHISFYLNVGLLEPMECIRAVEAAFYHNQAPLNAVEGFIRQILGWREFVRGIYWLKMPEYAHSNFLEAQRKLPEFFWNGDTKMHCLCQAITETKKNAYAHHIQRLMVIGNFALLAGLSPDEVNEWYLIVYADAYEWVELPNVTGMILFADGGYLASKPYVSGGAYINRMSDYCKNCYFKVNQKTGESACPFNYLYWNFLLKHADKLCNNQRLSMMYRTLSQMSEDKKTVIIEDSKRFLEQL